jgi:subtilisin-like proprotein convertase family protein
LAIPDNDSFGVFDELAVEEFARIEDIDVSIEIEHSWVGDLSVDLLHVDSRSDVILLHRPGYPAADVGCAAADIDGFFDDEAAVAAEDQCSQTRPAIGGRVRPLESLSGFEGESIAGTWSLGVADHQLADVGALVSWCLEVTLAPEPTPGGPA